MMNYLKGGIALAVVGYLGWTFLSPTKPDVDLAQVLDRTVYALENYNKHLKKNGTTEVNEKHMAQLSGFMHKMMNVAPPLHENPIGVKLLKDASFEGFNDKNNNNAKDSGERKLFKVEVDFEGKRLIASSDKGGFTGMGLATGLLAGALMGRMMGNQRSAGVQSNRFNNRKVTSKTSYARSRARSGGRFGGK